MGTVGRDEQKVNLTSFAHTRPTCEDVKPYLDFFHLQFLSATRTWHIWSMRETTRQEVIARIDIITAINGLV